MSASAKALKLCSPSYTQSMPFQKLHEENKRATPDQYCFYKHLILLYNLYISHTPTKEWISLHFNQNFNTRNTSFKGYKNANYKIGRNNKISKRLTCFNSKIPLDLLNKDKHRSKITCNKLFLLNTCIIMSASPNL